ncbi:MAG: YcjX family protein [Rhodobacteraceae bacterium]|nr:YcjX family protein [Paracoccaceae bacterium]
MGLADIADDITRSIGDAAGQLSGALFDPVIRLGVTGLSRAGKTVFITSLVANLLDRGRMPQLLAASSGAIQAAWLQPQPDDTVPRFEYETHLAALMDPEPHWPQSTRQVSQLRLSLKVQPAGLLAGLSGPRNVHIDIVDYPGEWLLDLPLMDQDYAAWSDEALALAQGPARQAAAVNWLAALAEADADAPYDEVAAQALAAAFTAYLAASRDLGFSACAPGRFLMPGELAGSPALTFAPLPGTGRGPRGSLRREFARRFDAYKSKVVTPFFRDHFSRVDRQIVLVDALGAIHAGPPAVEDLRQAMAGVLKAFRPGRNSWLSFLTGRRVDRILFAATKADHLHHSQHAKLTAIMEALLRDARDRADFAGAETAAMSIASLRATVEETRDHGGRKLDCVRGTLENGKSAAFHPGDLPSDPGALLAPARRGAEKWLDEDYQVMQFAPARLVLKPGEGPPHIRLDKAAEFLLGDRFR